VQISLHLCFFKYQKISNSARSTKGAGFLTIRPSFALQVAEHMMLVDLERHDLGHASIASTVAWDRWRVEAFPNIQHMVSKVGCLFFLGGVAGFGGGICLSQINSRKRGKKKQQLGSVFKKKTGCRNLM